MAHEIEIRHARHGLENAAFLVTVSKRTATTRASCDPLALESSHDSFGQHGQMEEFCGISFAENIHEFTALVNALVFLEFSVYGKTHGLFPVVIRICKEHADEKAARQTSLISRVVAVRFGIYACMDAHEFAHTLGEKM